MTLEQIKDEAVKKFKKITHNQEFLKGVPVDLQKCWSDKLEQFLLSQLEKSYTQGVNETLSKVKEMIKVKYYKCEDVDSIDYGKMIPCDKIDIYELRHQLSQLKVKEEK